MKLRNKKTGEIGEFCCVYANELRVAWTKDDGVWTKQEYNSLAELNEEWEDYEEPKDYYYISSIGNICVCGIGEFTEDEENQKQIGNYFETKEEAEKAVEKLKAWKRLKDKGFEISGFEHIGANGWVKGKINFLIPKDNLDEADLDLLFGGEE